VQFPRPHAWLENTQPQVIAKNALDGDNFRQAMQHALRQQRASIVAPALERSRHLVTVWRQRWTDSDQSRQTHHPLPSHTNPSLHPAP